MKLCCDCKKPFADDQITDMDGDDVCGACRQSREHGFKAMTNQMGLSGEGLALRQAFAWAFLQSCGFNVVPPKKHRYYDLQQMEKALKKLEAVANCPPIITASDAIDADVLLGKYRTMFCEADRLRQKMELYLDHERDADGESLNLTEKQKQQLIAKQGPPEFRAALQAACDAILKMYMLCPPDMRGFITVPTPPWMKE